MEFYGSIIARLQWLKFSKLKSFDPVESCRRRAASRESSPRSAPQVVDIDPMGRSGSLMDQWTTEHQ